MPEGSGTGLTEAEIRAHAEAGGHIKGLFVVERPNPPPELADYVVYIRTSWSRSYRILRTWRDRGDRRFRDFNRLLTAMRELGYRGPVTVYAAGSPDLARFRGVSVADGGTPPNRLNVAAKPKDDKPWGAGPEDETPRES